VWSTLALACFIPAAASGQAEVRWLPGALIEGSLFTVVTLMSDPAFVPLRGTLNGEPLHFRPSTNGYRSLAAVPVGAPDSIPLELHVATDSGIVEGVIAWIPVARRQFARERIRTSPEFAKPPDAALAARIAAERERIREVQRGTHDRPPLWSPAFQKPRPSAITSRFGTQRIVNGAEGGRHWGTDLAGRTGAPVRATNRGVVALTGDFYYGGRLVYLDHGAGLITGYLHLSEVLVAPGDTVQAGQIIGRVGATGRVTGPHLHWLANYGRISVDPMSLLEIKR
jgi:hypothetical protein